MRLAEPRPFRVCVLLAAVTLLSLGDLWMTILYTTSVGLIESNPIARLVMSHNSVGLLTLWKAATVGLGVGILYRTRRTRFGEVGAWVCFLILAWLTVRWAAYNDSMLGTGQTLATMSQNGDQRLVLIEP